MTYSEYQDFYLELILSDKATFIDQGGNPDYIKADLESRNANPGEYWIRYKNSSWTVGSESATAWGWYFYCDATKVVDSIDINNLPTNLSLAVEETVKKHKQIHGIHDMMFHDYGHSQQFMTFHAEVDAREDVIKLDDSIVPNGIGKVLKKLHLFAVQFYQPDFEVTAMNSPDLTKELSGLVTSLFLIMLVATADL